MKPHGLYTAVITPFHSDGSIDFAAFRRILTHQLEGGVDGIVVCGSTGEGATLSVDEKETLWSLAVEHVAGAVPIVAGTGTNSTSSTIELSKRAQRCGVNALLLVTPYYNKPTQAGILAHHRAVAEAVDLPQIIYNVPGRTGVNITAATQVAIAATCPNVVATKEASANLEQMCQIITDAPEHFVLLAGDDSLALPAIACGATGVIAVVSNYAPRMYGRLIHTALRGDLAAARQLQGRLMPWYSANFIESNPLPVKYIMHRLGLCEAEWRLPLVPPQATTMATLDAMVTGFVDMP
jgi:4-hydroxy-tetrahydrodipicolinate synthase